MDMKTSMGAGRGVALVLGLLGLGLLGLGGAAPGAFADAGRVYLPAVQPAGKVGENAILGRVKTLSIEVKSDDITQADELTVATLVDALKQSLIEQLGAVQLDGEDAFKIVPGRAPHLLKITARLKSTTKELNYSTEEVDHENCIRLRTDGQYYEYEDRDEVVVRDGRVRIKGDGDQFGFGSSVEQCEEFGTKRVEHRCTVDHISYSGQTELVENKRRGKVLYSRPFAHTQLPDSCERENQTQILETSFVEEFAKEIRHDFAPHRTRDSSPLDLRRPKRLEKPHRKTWKRHARILEDYQGRTVAPDELWWSSADPKRWSGPQALLKRACDFFEEIKDGTTYDSGIVLFNRGLCAEYDGRLDDAEVLYLTAQVAQFDMGGKKGRRLMRRITLALGRLETERTNRKEAFSQLGEPAKK